MESLHDICLQLMKPPKDLAQWNYPLADLLESYVQLILETNDFKFTEVGLVIQNSANAYGKRIEALLSEVLSFSSRVITREEEEKVSNAKERKKTSKKIDFDDFGVVNIETKDLTLKDDEIKKPMKLLPKQFLKVEKRFTGNSTETVMDVHGEIIGKKYDFRCNLDMNKYGMLVEETIPADFVIGSTSLAAAADVLSQSDLIDDSGYDSLNVCSVELEDDNVNESTTAEFDACSTSHESQPESEPSGSNVDNLDDCEKSNACDEASETSTENSNVSELREVTLEISDKLIQQNSQTEQRRNDEPEKKSDVGTSKTSTNWEPIPFDQGIPDKLPRKRREFKLPCHIDLLTKKPTRKRKTLKPIKSLTDFILDEESRSKKPKLEQESSLTDIRNSLLKQEHLEEFKKSFEMCLGSCLYEVPSIMMGLDVRFSRQNLPLDSPAHSTNMDDVLMLEEAETLRIPDSYTPPTSPEDFASFDQHDDSALTAASGKKSYDDIVKKRINDIQKSRKRTILEETVMRWHETIKPKLAAAEKIKQFDINLYGTQILSKLAANQERKLLLSNMVENRPRNEAARFFSATLQLANTYNVDIKECSDASNVELLLLKESISGAADNFQLPTSTLKRSKKNS